ncbi:MAG TPA: DNA recombination protein RmuC [Chryseosolibacter sp.]
MEVVWLIIGAGFGAVVAWFAVRAKAGNLSAESRAALLVEQEKIKTLQSQLTDAKRELENERAKVSEATSALATTEADYRNLQEKLNDQKKDLESLQDKFTEQFKNLANDILEEKTKKFTEQNKSNIFELLKPLGEKITEFEKKVEDTHKDSISRNSALKEQLENLQRLNIQMTREAENLTRALKGDSQTQGAWGEFILESILEKSGLEKDREYTIQETYTGEDGRRRRPDVIIRLPENRQVIIDSKVSLTAYDNFMNAKSDEEKMSHLKAHVISIRQHLRGLSDKNYQSISDRSLDFIIMFIPIEPAYILAIQSEKNLYEDALDRRIIFVSPTLLIPSLQLIKNVWKQEYQNRNTMEIARHATSLYEKFVGFTSDLIDIGNQIKKSQTAYENAMNKLTTGNGNIVKSIERFKTLGIKPSKNIDPRLVDRSSEQKDLFE